VYDEIEAISRCLTYLEREDYLNDFIEKLWLEWLVLGLETVVENPFAMLRTICANIALDFKPFTRHDIDLF
jgi:hypothetical protein